MYNACLIKCVTTCLYWGKLAHVSTNPEVNVPTNTAHTGTHICDYMMLPSFHHSSHTLKFYIKM